MCTWTFGASIMTVLLSAAGSQQAHELRDHLGLGGVVDERSLPAALDELGAPEQVEMVRQRRAGDLQLRLDVADRDLTLLTDEEKEDLEASGVRERFEGFDVSVARLESRQGDWFHISKYMETSKQCQRRFDQRGAVGASRNSSAAARPAPRRIGTPKSFSISSTPASAPISSSSFRLPRWPMRKTLPFTAPSPTPREKFSFP